MTYKLNNNTPGALAFMRNTYDARKRYAYLECRGDDCDREWPCFSTARASSVGLFDVCAAFGLYLLIEL